ncbi:Fructose import ATP-binding protein FruK [Paraburkholderia domus]|uniref:ATP-binding cassette domain-containing protein n=1 Tax=Paraburkholderia domus TaxID=2793075 RepID=UPI001911E1BD|nr:sugar ABC transporter ATP-binding protein [Paraburkholderia domus]MBK5091355.1 sugar ABC transporter ATP-binding protein [Burkholderia sp. R-69927]CAE6934649.1 Fructose import ATP-binding protein FruK [Paraburkholderia domus]
MNRSDSIAIEAMHVERQFEPLISVHNIDVSFGLVRALRDANFQFMRGECVAIAGHNGAGKSTLMSVLSGARRASAGWIEHDEIRHERGYSADIARGLGVRCVFQELSLCPNLTIEENMRAMHPQLKGIGWRKRARRIIEAQLDAIFPGHALSGTDVVGNLSLTQQQMVEIARAFSSVDTPVKVVILDEPTSSLDKYTSEQLLAFVRKAAANGITSILITHMLGEMLRCADRIMVMRDGSVVSTLSAHGLTNDAIIRAMGQFVEGDMASGREQRATTHSDEVYKWTLGPKERTTMEVPHGSIVGLAGLAGQGQTDALNEIYAKARRRGSHQRVAYVAGDRRADGVFPDWTIAQNFSIRSLFDRARGSWINVRHLQALFDVWAKRLDIRGAAGSANILALSGGNQQKVLFGRALASDAELVLMDDPMRGVDIGTKLEIYRLLLEEAAKGRTFVWYTTENDELAYCDKTYVFRSGRITRELRAAECTEEALLAASFEEATE